MNKTQQKALAKKGLTVISKIADIQLFIGGDLALQEAVKNVNSVVTQLDKGKYKPTPKKSFRDQLLVLRAQAEAEIEQKLKQAERMVINIEKAYCNYNGKPLRLIALGGMTGIISVYTETHIDGAQRYELAETGHGMVFQIADYLNSFTHFPAYNHE